MICNILFIIILLIIYIQDSRYINGSCTLINRYLLLFYYSVTNIEIITMGYNNQGPEKGITSATLWCNVGEKTFSVREENLFLLHQDHWWSGSQSSCFEIWADSEKWVDDENYSIVYKLLNMVTVITILKLLLSFTHEYVVLWSVPCSTPHGFLLPTPCALF